MQTILRLPIGAKSDRDCFHLIGWMIHVALRHLLQHHEKWKRRKRIPGVSMVFLQSKSEFALADDPANQPVDVVDRARRERLGSGRGAEPAAEWVRASGGASD